MWNVSSYFNKMEMVVLVIGNSKNESEERIITTGLGMLESKGWRSVVLYDDVPVRSWTH